jgi:hypothetical protein
MTETVMTLAGRTGFSPAAAERGAFSLPGNTTRGWAEKRRADFFDGMGSSPVEYDAHHIPVCCRREVPPTIIKVTFTHAGFCEEFSSSRQPGNRPCGGSRGLFILQLFLFVAAVE